MVYILKSGNMPEFIPVLIAACVVFVALYGLVNADFSDFFESPKMTFTAQPAQEPEEIRPVMFVPQEEHVQARNSKSINLDNNIVVGGPVMEIINVSGKAMAGMRAVKENSFVFNSSRYDRGFLHFLVYETNHYGQLIFELNGQEIYRG